MARKIIIWSETAVRQRRGIFQYWNNRNKSTNYTNRLRKLINERINLIQSNPEAYLNSGFNENHVTIIEHFCLYYKILQEEILITAFWDSRQDPDNLLKILKN